MQVLITGASNFHRRYYLPVFIYDTNSKIALYLEYIGRTFYHSA